MNRIEYMNQLAHMLKRLPKEDYDKAMDYFNEYFDEAGPENEQQAIEDLGSPEAAANSIVMDLAIYNAKEPGKNMKRGLKNIWVGILAIFAAPVAVPLAIAAVAVVASLIIALLAVVFSVVICAAAFAAMAVVGFVGSICLMFVSFSDGLINLGLFTFCIGLGIFVGWGAMIFCKWCINGIARVLGKMIGGKKHGKK